MSIDVRQVGNSSWELAFSTHAPCELVYDYVLDVERHGEWEDELTEVAHRSGERGHAGGVFVKTYGQRPQGFLKRMFSDAVRSTARSRPPSGRTGSTGSSGSPARAPTATTPSGSSSR